jgi:two-component system, OmpR family, heavy metal sensor histidine kinase CusS
MSTATRTRTLREFAQGPTGVRDLHLPGEAYPFKVLISQIPAKEQRPALRFLIAIDTARPFARPSTTC